MNKSDKNQELYEHLVQSYAVELYRFAVRLCGHKELAEDLVQETFYEGWRSIKKLRDPSRGKAWIYTILRHRYSHWIRSNKKQPTSNVSIDELEISGSISSFSEDTDMVDQQMLQKALNRLDDRYKVPFLMVYIGGYSCQETADALNTPLGTVLSRIYRAKNFLCQFLTENNNSVTSRKKYG